MSTTNEVRKLIIRTIINKKSEKETSDVHPSHFIELFDRELNGGMYILRDDSNRILNKKINGSWLIRRASIKGNKKMFPFIISYKYFNIYNHIFCYIENKGIIELDSRYYNGGDLLPEYYENLKVKNSIYKDMFEIFEHYGLTFSHKLIKKLSKEISDSNSISSSA
jgi:hypothetical protein